MTARLGVQVARNIGEWLDELGLRKYAEVFAQNDVGVDVLPHLTEQHLKEIGVSLGDRVRLLKAIERMNGDQPSPTRTEAARPSDAISQAERRAPRGESERRQLTVMFCDLVGSTGLSARLDPEDMQDLIRAYRETCSRVVTEYNGYIAKFMGDGVLAYFGYPQALGNDAERAVRAGLSIVDSMADFKSAISADTRLDLAVRIGIDTGLVVVGDIIGTGSAEEANVVGETPNVAARLQAVAQPNEVVVGPLTRTLIGDALIFESLGEQPLKGIAEPVHVWRVRRLPALDGAPDDPGSPAVSRPFVGRQEELGLLLRSWEASKARHGQVVSIQGEAGIGKSRLIDALRAQLPQGDYTWVAIRCSPYHSNTSLYPVIEHMKRAFGWRQEDSPDAKLEKMEAALQAQSLPLQTAVPLYANLISFALPEGRYPPLDLSASEIRDQTLDALAGWLMEESERKPVLQVWEDLHWADPTTIELLGIFIDQSPTVSMMNVLTSRPDFRPPWPARSHITPITLNRLEQPEVEAIIAHHAGGRSVPREVVRHIVDKADGVPLYVEELTKTILSSEYLREEADRYSLVRALSDVSIPATLQDTLMARLDRLPRVREIAQLGAVLGREFAYEMLRALVEVEEPHLRDGLGQLVDAELLYQRGRVPRAKYIFKHALIQDAAYASLLKRTRQQYHSQVAALLEERFPETVEAHPELVAHHHAEAAHPRRAVHYWLQAGERARAQSANIEAIAYFTKGIELLQLLPDDGERARQELALQVPLGHANIVARGHGAPDAQLAYARALELCERIGDAPELAATLFGLWRFYVVARNLDEANGVALRLDRIAREKHRTELCVVSGYARGYTALCKGDLTEARNNLEGGILRYRPEQRADAIYRMAQDPGVACRGYLGMTKWLLGYPEQAQTDIAESIELAERLNDAFSLAYALCFPGAIVTEECSGDTGSILTRGLQIANERHFALWAAFAEVHQRSRTLAATKSVTALDALATSVAAVPQMGVLINSPYFATHLARGYHEFGRSGDGLRVLDEVTPSMDARGEYWWRAEVLRLRGELLLGASVDNGDAAEACFRQAIRVAQMQEAKSLELRAAMSLAALWAERAKSKDARRLLGDCLSWFSEGERTRDHGRARKLLDTL
jgi:class 3 adenylate cyclase/tetratricopeptide (TPR) repeat protein